MRIRPLFEWRDMWIGAYWSTEKRRLYVCLLPCIGFFLDFGSTKTVTKKPGKAWVVDRDGRVRTEWDRPVVIMARDRWKL